MHGIGTNTDTSIDTILVVNLECVYKEQNGFFCPGLTEYKIVFLILNPYISPEKGVSIKKQQPRNFAIYSKKDCRLLTTDHLLALS